MKKIRKDRKIKLIAIIALVLAITGMTFGFAAFSTTLNISSNASVNPNSADFSVKFSTSKDSLVANEVSPSNISSGISASNGVIENGASPTLTNLSATFTRPGQYVEYIVYARNEGQYTAYLNSINFIGNKECVGTDEATDSLVQNACDSINVDVTVGGNTYNNTTSITNHSLAKGVGEEIKIKLEYDISGTWVDGEFSITFPDVSFLYSTVDDSSIITSVPCGYTVDNSGNEMVKCGTESFFVIEKTSDLVTMFSQYNITLSETNPVQDPTDTYLYESKNSINRTNTSLYIDAYKSKLVEMGISVIDVALISKEQLALIGCRHNGDTITYFCSSAPDFVAGCYWVGFKHGSSTLNMSNKDLSAAGNDGCSGMCDRNIPGIRPVVKISASNIR